MIYIIYSFSLNIHDRDLNRVSRSGDPRAPRALQACDFERQQEQGHATIIIIIVIMIMIVISIIIIILSTTTITTISLLLLLYIL